MTVPLLAFLTAIGLPLLMAWIAWYSERSIPITEGMANSKHLAVPTTQAVVPTREQTFGPLLWDESGDIFDERPANVILWEYSNDAQLEWTLDEKLTLWSDETFRGCRQDARLEPTSDTHLTLWSDDGLPT